MIQIKCRLSIQLALFDLSFWGHHNIRGKTYAKDSTGRADAQLTTLSTANQYHLNNAGREKPSMWWNAWCCEVQGGRDQREHEHVLSGWYHLCVCATRSRGSRRGSPRGGEMNSSSSFLDESG